jgi:hypothetical protein
MNLIGRLFGPRQHPRPEPSAEDVAAVDVDRMVATARERGDGRDEDEVLAGLLVGADFTAQRHKDESMRLRAAAAGEAVRNRLVARVGEERAAELFIDSAGPVGEDGRPRRP